MTLQFTVLASGSAGNACYLNADGFGLLLDAGLGPRTLTARLAVIGVSWSKIRAFFLTHTHADHWKDRTLAQLLAYRIPIHCHAEHYPSLLREGKNFAKLQAAGLVRALENNVPILIGDCIQCRPLPLRHDAGLTFGFRFEGKGRSTCQDWSLGYAADLGSWTEELAQALADVDLLALEFNHDVDLETGSGRSPDLIQRILGDHGHLSNSQAAALLRAILHRSTPGRLQQIVQLHLSQECNRPEIAAQAAQSVLADFPIPIRLHTASQDRPSPIITLKPQAANGRALPKKADEDTLPASLLTPPCQLLLPGWES